MFSLMNSLRTTPLISNDPGRFKEKKWDTRRMLSSGGMPSSHSSTVTALATCIVLQEGIGSSSFAIAVVLAYGIDLYFHSLYLNSRSVVEPTGRERPRLYQLHRIKQVMLSEHVHFMRTSGLRDMSSLKLDLSFCRKHKDTRNMYKGVCLKFS